MHVEERASGWVKETQKGYIRIAVLILLDKKPNYGYEIMKELEERTNGFWKPTAGGIYPILQNLERSEYIRGEWDCDAKRKKKIYSITSDGKKILEYTLVKENRLFNTIMDLLKEYMKNVLDIPVSSIQFPKPPFALFLEENTCKPKDTKNVLESKRLRIESIIKSMQEKLVQIDLQLAKIEKKKIRK
ncbi:MAG: PadR family transcriptional regulator [Nitrososphaerota archaeon]|jgi:DNA-binding PadR family transcriptional regulator|nr:PadR family transcriptional regulator [Nitrososphaerota archaeon]